MIQILRSLPAVHRKAYMLLAALLLLSAAGAAWWRLGREGGDPACPALAETLPVPHEALAALTWLDRGRDVRSLSFLDAGGGAMRVGDLSGSVILLNLWAMWCPPCRHEMPMLNRLQQQAEGEEFRVVAVNIDTRDPDKAREWMEREGLAALGFHSDPTGRIFTALKTAGLALGMPTSLLIDSEGCARGVLHGAADWASPEAMEMIRGLKRASRLESFPQ